MRASDKLAQTRLTIVLLLAVGWLGLAAQRNALSGGASASALQAGLELTKADAPDPVLAGNSLTYTLTLRNLGPDVAQLPSLNDPLPSATNFQSLTSPPGWMCNTPVAGTNGSVSCNTPTLAPGATASFTLVVQVLPNTPHGAVITNTATATALNLATVNATVTTNVAAQANLGLTKTAPAMASAGTNFTYNFTLTNLGPSNAASATFTDTLPTGTVFVSSTTPAGFICTTPAPNANGTVTCTAPTFAGGANVTFTITGRLNANVACNTNLVNQATVASQTFDETPGNNTATATTLAQAQSDLAITSTATPNQVPIGDTVTYTLTITNNGPSNSVGTRITDTLPPGFTANSATASAGTCTGIGTGTVNCTLGTLAPGSTATATIAAHVPGLCQPATAVNTATVTSDNCLADPLPGNNTTTFTTTVAFPNIGPGQCYPSGSAVSASKAGSVLGFPFYTSSASNGNDSNTRIALTNTHPALGVALHLFFVDGAGCSVADLFLCLTANQTAAFLLSDIDPGVGGYLIAIAVDGPPGFADGGNTGCPISFNYLIGQASIKMPASGSSIGNSALVPTKRTRVEAELEAEAIAAQFGSPVPGCNANSTSAELRFDGTPTGYNQLPRVLAASNIPSRADGNSTLLVINRIGGNLGVGAATLGTLFGILYDDAESSYSFQLTGACQLRAELSNTFLRTTPRFDAIIPAGRSGWLKISTAGDFAIIGATINNNVNVDAVANAFDGGHMLHKLTLTNTAVLTVPVFPPSC